MVRHFRKYEQRSQPFARTLRKQMTDAEVILWSYLRRGLLTGLRFRRQHPIGPYVADFAGVSARLVVEIDGDTHFSADEKAYDRSRDAYIRYRGWRVLRVTNMEVYRNLSGVLDIISHHACAHTPPSSPSATLPPQAGGENG
jgi:very-short-patch-repair endonuclease